MLTQAEFAVLTFPYFIMLRGKKQQIILACKTHLA